MDHNSNSSQAASLKQVGAALPSLERLRSGNVTFGKTITIEKATLAIERATLMYGCYRKDDACDPQTFLDAAAAILADYPDDVIIVVTDPRSGLPGKIKWPPQPQEVKQACETIEAPRRDRRAYEERSTKQLRARAEIDAKPKTKSTYEEIKADMAARGMSFDGKKHVDVQEEKNALKKKYNLTEAQWDALPDLPLEHADYWAGKRHLGRVA